MFITVVRNQEVIVLRPDPGSIQLYNIYGCRIGTSHEQIAIGLGLLQSELWQSLQNKTNYKK